MNLNNFTFNTTSGIRFGMVRLKVVFQKYLKNLDQIFYLLQTKI